MWQINLGTKYSRFFNFRSFLIGNNEPNLFDTLNGNLFFVVPFLNPLGVTWEYERKKRINENPIHLLRNRLVTQLGPVSVNHAFTYAGGNLRDVEGRLDLNLSLNPLQIRAGMDYAIERIHSYDFDLIFSPSGKYSVIGSAVIPNDGRNANFGLSFAKNFRVFTGTVDFNLASPKDYSAGMSLVFSLIPNFQDGVTLRSEPQTNYGYASVKVFLDRNRNGIQDRGEPPLPKMSLTVDQREDVYFTDRDGIATIYSLTPYQPHDISVGYRQLNNPFWKPLKSGIRIYPRPSKMFQGVLPIGVVGAIDGSVIATQEKLLKSKNRIAIHLVDIRNQLVGTVKTDRDGFYTFEDIAPGEYWVRMNPSYLEKNRLRSVPNEMKVRIESDGSFESEKNFNLSRD